MRATDFAKGLTFMLKVVMMLFSVTHSTDIHATNKTKIAIGIYENSGVRNPKLDYKVEAVADQLNSLNAHVIVTRYEVHENLKVKVNEMLSKYVTLALTEENNIMAEVFQEEGNHLVLWTIERWNSQDNFVRFSRSSQIKTIGKALQGGLSQSMEVHHLTDLAPLSKSEWRKSPAKEDIPIIIMLFVDCKAGTQDEFAKLYATAMPKFRSELGVITYGLAQDNSQKTQFVTHEKFRSEDAFQYHLKFPPIEPVLNFLQTSIKEQPFQKGLHRLVPLRTDN